MKKKYLSIIAIGLVAAGLSSCKDTLDTHPTSTFDEATVWGSKATADAFVHGTYDVAITNLGLAGSGSCTSWEARTPNAARCSQVGEGIDNIATELGLSTSTDAGISRFGLLRRCNLIIQKAQESEALTQAEKEELISQGRFLRGLVFFDQARKMGRFVPMTEVLEPADSLKAKIPMTKTVAESYKYVMDDLEAAIPAFPTSAEPGLPNKYAAEVIASRAALQAYAYTGDQTYLDKAIQFANDVVTNGPALSSNYGGMFNETNDMDPEILWGYYRLQTNTTIGGYEELIRTYPNISPGDQTNSLCPQPLKMSSGAPTFEAWAIFFPTQDLVDQYLVVDEATGKALPWYETSQYKSNVTEHNPLSVTQPGQIDQYEQANGNLRRIPTPQDFQELNNAHPAATRYATLNAGVTDRDISDIMYQNRDARFYTSIVYDKGTWVGETVGLNLAGNISMGVRDKEDGGWYNTTTGYYWAKCNIKNPEPRAYFSCKVALHYNIARVGEAYMNLAEAYLLKGNVTEAVKALNATRTQHGKLPASTASNLADAWADYMRERRVEMCHEGGDIYFSYLRWGKYGGHSNYGRPAGDIIYDLDRPVYKIEINRDRTAFIINQLTLLNSANRTFTERRYLFPIPQGFLDTREAYGLDFEQNDLW